MIYVFSYWKGGGLVLFVFWWLCWSGVVNWWLDGWVFCYLLGYDGLGFVWCEGGYICCWNELFMSERGNDYCMVKVGGIGLLCFKFVWVWCLIFGGM